MDTEMIPVAIAIGVIVTFFITAIIAIWNYGLYEYVFGHGCYRRGTSITDKVWFRGLMAPLVYFPVLNLAGLIILLYMSAMKKLDIN